MELAPEWSKSFSRLGAAQHALRRFDAAVQTLKVTLQSLISRLYAVLSVPGMVYIMGTTGAGTSTLSRTTFKTRAKRGCFVSTTYYISYQVPVRIYAYLICMYHTITKRDADFSQSWDQNLKCSPLYDTILGNKKPSRPHGGRVRLMHVAYEYDIGVISVEAYI